VKLSRTSLCLTLTSTGAGLGAVGLVAFGVAFFAAAFVATFVAGFVAGLTARAVVFAPAIDFPGVVFGLIAMVDFVGLYDIYSLYEAHFETTVHTVPVQPRYTPTSVGALMDPMFLKQAVTDMVATTDAEGPQVASIGDVLKATAQRVIATLRHRQ